MRRLILALALLVSAGPLWGEEMMLTPNWQDRMAAPPDAVAVWQVRNARGALVGEGAAAWRGGPVRVTWSGAAERVLLGLVSDGRAIWQGTIAAQDGRSGPMPLARAPAGRDCSECGSGRREIVSLFGEAGPEGAELDLTEARVSLTGGCNRIAGPYDPGAGIAGPFAMTRMACPAPLMAADDRMIAALEQGGALARGQDGELLILRDGLVLLEARPM